jgi:hypothetical protein
MAVEQMVNSRERISRKGWRTKNLKLIKLAEEYRAIKWGEPVSVDLRSQLTGEAVRQSGEASPRQCVD